MSKEVAIWEPPVSGKGPSETGHRGHNAKTAGQPDKRDGRLHGSCSSRRARSLVEDLHDGVARRGLQCILDVSDAEQQGEDECESYRAVDYNRLDEHLGNHRGRIADFFAHVNSSIEA